MTVLVRHFAADMDTATYDQIAPGLTEMVKKQPGFIMHAAYETPGGMTVGEIWETQDQHDTWFEANVKPNVPAEIKVEVIPIHNFVTP